jgi:hypothetical protein
MSTSTQQQTQRKSDEQRTGDVTERISRIDAEQKRSVVLDCFLAPQNGILQASLAEGSLEDLTGLQHFSQF